MRLCGIHYDIGTQTIEGSSTRPILSVAQMQSEIADISQGLNANSIRITGDQIVRMAPAGEIAAQNGLEVWLSPMIPNADQSTTLDRILEAAKLAENLRRGGATTVLILGCELSVFMRGILPGATHADRLALLSDPTRLVAEITTAGIDPQKDFTAFLSKATDQVRSVFQGPMTYASGIWETVDWSLFDFIGIDAYRDASNRQDYPESLRRLASTGRPVVITEFGCATYRGAADAGGLAWTAVDRSGPFLRLRDGTERDEDEQAKEISAVLALAEASGVDGAFVYTYIMPSYPSCLDPRQDLDVASYALVRSWPDGRTEQKQAYKAVTSAYAASRQS